MTEKSIVEKAGEAVGYGMAMASDVAGTIKTAFDAAVTTVGDALKKAPATKASKKAVAKKAAKNSPAKKSVVKKTPAKKATVKKTTAKTSPAKKATKKSVTTPAKNASRLRR
jgi:hypothetical protein